MDSPKLKVGDRIIYHPNPFFPLSDQPDPKRVYLITASDHPHWVYIEMWPYPVMAMRCARYNPQV